MPQATRKAAGPGLPELRKVRERELELRRMSGEISCSDCRRLKLKCDKKIPCSSCVRRGAGSLCPLGAGRSKGHGQRAGPSSDSQRTNRKLTILSERIRALEDALALESESDGRSSPHPLLSERLLAIKQCIDEDEGDEDEEEEDNQLLGAFGTLSIDEARTMRYLGPAASESVLLMEALENNAPPSITASILASSETLTPGVIHTSNSFPFEPSFLSQDGDTLVAQLLTYLPPYERATALYEAFFRNLSWFVAPIERCHFVSEIIPLFYPNRRPITPTLLHKEHAQDLALLYVVLACGSVGDLTQSPINDEADRYHKLTKAALSVKSVMHGASLSGVQTLYLLSSYEIFSGRKPNQEDAWKLVSLGSSMAASIGLHRDPSRWGFEPKIVDRRRRVFWEIYSMDIWRNIQTGRPSGFSPNVVDCEFPIDHDAILGEDGEVIESISQCRYRFLRDIMTDVSEKICSARPLKYRDVLELDRRLREFTVHPFAARPPTRKDDLGVDPDFHRLHPLVTVWEKEETLMYIHRNFFARAILEHPDNPMRSPFASSFLATYRSASAILRICRENMADMYLTVLRIWSVWSLCFTCAVTVGAVASLGTSVNFATSAFVELEYAISLFEKYSEHKVAKHGLPVLQRIREKAAHALQKSRTSQPASADGARQFTRIPTIRSASDNVEEELLILRGTTRVVEYRSSPVRGDHIGTKSTDVSASLAMSMDTTGTTSNGDSSHSTAYLSESVDIVQPEQSVFMEDASDKLPLHDVQTNISIPQLHDAHSWLAELEQFLGPTANVQHSNAINQYHEPQLHWPSASRPSTWTSSIDSTPLISASSNLPSTSSHDGLAETAFSDIFLDETVSTEEWRAFMQQSGYSDSPPFDFVLDSVGQNAFGEHERREEDTMLT